MPYSTGNEIRVFRSTDGGANWTSSTGVSGVVNEHNVGGNLRTSALPSAEVAGDGRVYVVWQDCRFRTSCSANDIVMSTSTDGNAWTAVTRIPIDPADSGVDHFIPGIAVDKATSGSAAHLALGYYYYPVSNCNVSTCQLTVGFVSSLDGGATWTTPTRVAGPMNLSWIANTDQGKMVGDYMSTSFTGDGKAHPGLRDRQGADGQRVRRARGERHLRPDCSAGRAEGTCRQGADWSIAGPTAEAIRTSAVRTRRNARKRLTSSDRGGERFEGS